MSRFVPLYGYYSLEISTEKRVDQELFMALSPVIHDVHFAWSAPGFLPSTCIFINKSCISIERMKKVCAFFHIFLVLIVIDWISLRFSLGMRVVYKKETVTCLQMWTTRTFIFFQAHGRRLSCTPSPLREWPTLWRELVVWDNYNTVAVTTVSAAAAPRALNGRAARITLHMEMLSAKISSTLGKGQRDPMPTERSWISTITKLVDG